MLDLTRYTYKMNRYNTQRLESMFARLNDIFVFDIPIYLGMPKEGNRKAYRYALVENLNDALNEQLKSAEYAYSYFDKMWNAITIKRLYEFSDNEIVHIHNMHSNYQLNNVDLAYDRLYEYFTTGQFPKGRPASLSSKQFDQIVSLYENSNHSVNLLARYFTDDLSDDKRVNSTYNVINQYLCKQYGVKKLPKREHEEKFDKKDCDHIEQLNKQYTRQNQVNTLTHLERIMRNWRNSLNDDQKIDNSNLEILLANTKPIGA